jgi:hypothetical protein
MLKENEIIQEGDECVDESCGWRKVYSSIGMTVKESETVHIFPLGCENFRRPLKPEYILIFENGDPVRLVDSMDKFHKHVEDNPQFKVTWLSFELE